MKTILTLLLAGLIVFTMSCGGSSLSSPPPTMTGDWSFTGTSQKFIGASGTGTGALVQSGNSVTGTLHFSGACAASASLAGTVTGASLSFQLNESAQIVSFTGTLNPSFSSASGTFTSPEGGCANGDFGTWIATKVN